MKRGDPNWLLLLLIEMVSSPGFGILMARIFLPDLTITVGFIIDGLILVGLDKVYRGGLSVLDGICYISIEGDALFDSCYNLRYRCPPLVV